MPAFSSKLRIYGIRPQGALGDDDSGCRALFSAPSWPERHLPRDALSRCTPASLSLTNRSTHRIDNDTPTLPIHNRRQSVPTVTWTPGLEHYGSTTSVLGGNPFLPFLVPSFHFIFHWVLVLVFDTPSIPISSRFSIIFHASCCTLVYHRRP